MTVTMHMNEVTSSLHYNISTFFSVMAFVSVLCNIHLRVCVCVPYIHSNMQMIPSFTKFSSRCGSIGV